MPSPTTRQDKAPGGLLPRLSSCWWGRLVVEEEKCKSDYEESRWRCQMFIHPGPTFLRFPSGPGQSWARKIRKGNQVFPQKKTTRSLSVVEGIVRDALVTNFWETTFATLWMILNIPGLPEEVGRTGLLSSTTDKNSNSTGVLSPPAKEDETNLETPEVVCRFARAFMSKASLIDLY
jgi:hypothetical protein